MSTSIASGAARTVDESVSVLAETAPAPSNDLWVCAALCSLYRKPLPTQFVPATTLDRNEVLISTLATAGFTAAERRVKPSAFATSSFPLIVWLKTEGENGTDLEAGLVLSANTDQVVLAERSVAPRAVSLSDFAARFTGTALVVAETAPAVSDPDAVASQQADKQFGFRWFIPELLKHKRLWRDVLLASLVIQLLGLALPLITQAVIDKVIVHRTQSTLITLGIAMALFMVFTALLSWTRQYLILHTGNRVDAVLGASEPVPV